MSDTQKLSGNVSKDVPTFSLHAGKKSSSKFISHLLGLDQDLNDGKKNAASSAASAISSVKLSDALSGIKFTPNFMFLLLFLGFFFWLFVIYWIRHNEPLADSVLGKPKVHPAAAAADRDLVARVKKTFPVHTSSTTGEVYVPGVPQNTAPAYQGYYASQSSAQGPIAAPQLSHSPYMQQYAQQYGQPTPRVVAPNQASLLASQGQGAAPAAFGSPAYAPAPSQQFHANVQSNVLRPAIDPMAQAYSVSGGNYMVGVQTGSGTKVKTIVSR